MKALVYNRYGGPEVLQLAEVDTPVPRPGEVLIRVKAVSLNAYDWRMLRGSPFLVKARQGLLRPKNPILGADIAGVVESVGTGAGADAAASDGFQPGIEVFGCLEGCGVSGLAAGGLAQFVAAKPSVLAPKPPNLDFEQAAALPMAGGTALIAVRDVARVTPGMNVLVNGAAGGVGSFAVQIAKALGANVTGVCGTNHTDLVTSIGADQAIDYSTTDFARTGQTWDAIIDNVANRSVRDLRRALNPDGIIASVGFTSMRRLVGVGLAAAAKKASKRVAMVTADNKNNVHLKALAAMVESGQITPIMGRSYTFDQAAGAFGYLELGHADGKITIRLED